MRSVRVYLTPTSLPQALATGRTVVLPQDAAQHLTRVLRLRAGAAITLFDGEGGEWAAELVSGARDALAARIGEHHPIERESPLQLTLLQGLARGERMDLVIQKATELGVTRIVPLITSRCVVQLDAERGERRVEHWRAVAASACEQCGRNRLPEVCPPMQFESACQTPWAAADEPRWLLDPESTLTLRDVIAAPAALRRATLLVGPEGGLEASEIDLAVRTGFRTLRFGPRVLRTETAGLAALAALQSSAGDLS